MTATRATFGRRNPMAAVVGIDVAKQKLAVVLQTDAGKQRQKSCANTPRGHAELIQWLERHAEAGLAIGLEATGGYQEAVATALHDAGYCVSVLNPAAVAAYGVSQL